MDRTRALALAASIAALGGAPAPASACGGFFCDSGPGGGQTPVVQAAERVIFERLEDGRVRTYVQIRYQQAGTAPIGFSWIIPVMSVPEVGIADAATFNEIDTASAPQFRFVNNARPVASGGGGGACGSADAFGAPTAAGRAGEDAEVPGVMVWEETRVGDYETATISGETADQLLEWLELNDYDIPELAADVIGDYVAEGHLFVAFRYDPIGQGTGTLDPVVLTQEADKPCVPIRITAIASQPILDVVIFAFGPERASPEGSYVEVVPDYPSIRQDFSAPTLTTYADEVDRAVGRGGDHAWVVEFAGDSSSLTAINDVEARAITARNPYLTRFYTRFRPDTMTIDPEFEYTGGEDVSRLHVIDITADFAAAQPRESGLRYAAAPALLATSVLALLWRRRRD